MQTKRKENSDLLNPANPELASYERDGNKSRRSRKKRKTTRWLTFNELLLQKEKTWINHMPIGTPPSAIGAQLPIPPIGQHQPPIGSREHYIVQVASWTRAPPGTLPGNSNRPEHNISAVESDFPPKRVAGPSNDRSRLASATDPNEPYLITNRYKPMTDQFDKFVRQKIDESADLISKEDKETLLTDEDIEPPSHIIQAPYVPSGPMTRTRSKGLEKKFNIFVEQLEREGLIPLDQFEAIRLTSSESSQLKAVLNEVPPTTPDDPGDEPHTKLKLSESNFRRTKELPEINYKSPDMGRTASVCLVDSLINNEAKWALFTPKLEVHLRTCSLVLEGI
ncbi:unnamed protein product [Arabidopsis lyrata]|nr:unnamed protein product [Arabidopsis lyrata]